MKKIVSLALCLVIILSVAFQCSIQASAIAGVDDAVVLGVCLDLLALGISINSVSEFCKSDTFKDFCTDIGQHVDSGISTVKRAGKLFIASTKLAWQELCGWVKSKFKGGEHNKSIEYDVTVETHPSTLTLKDGTIVPYAIFMEHPFFIYRIDGQIRAVVCDGADPGMVWGTRLIQIWCVGTGKCSRFDISDGAWVNAWEVEMNYGLNYKGTTGSFYNLQFNSNVGANNESFYLYRTMQRTDSGGAVQESAPPNQVPEVQEPAPAVVVASSDPLYYPGAVDSPAQVLEDGDMVLIEVPQDLVVDSNTNNPTLTTDLDAIAEKVSTLTSADVDPRIITNTYVNNTTIDQVLSDTPAAELDGTNAGTAESDIESAFKINFGYLVAF